MYVFLLLGFAVSGVQVFVFGLEGCGVQDSGFVGADDHLNRRISPTGLLVCQNEGLGIYSLGPIPWKDGPETANPKP